jgi:hypothetical protein
MHGAVDVVAAKVLHGANARGRRLCVGQGGLLVSSSLDIRHVFFIKKCLLEMRKKILLGVTKQGLPDHFWYLREEPENPGQYSTRHCE